MDVFSLAIVLLVTWRISEGCIRPFYGSSCSEMCGAKLVHLSGTIYSPGYETSDGRYADDERCSWDIVPKNETSSVLVLLTFESFDTEGCCDYLKIFADSPTYSTELAKYYGDQLPFQALFKGPIRLYFYTDGSITATGFKLSYNILSGTPPRFVSLMNDTTVVRGDRVLLPCHVTGTPEPDVKWYKDGLEIDPYCRSTFRLEGNDLLLEEVVEEDAGVYKCRAENFVNATEQVFQLTVYVPPVIETHPRDVHLDSIFSGRARDPYEHFRRRYYYGFRDEVQAIFFCAVYGVPKPSVYWKKDGRLLSKTLMVTVMDMLVITPVSISDAGNYTCVANNTVGSAESRAASLTIGRVLPCCLYMRFRSNYYRQVATGSAVEMSVFFEYGSYAISNVTMTKDGYDYVQLKYQLVYFDFVRYPYYRVDLNLGDLTEKETGVYGWHFHLSSRNSSRVSATMAVSSYVVVVVQGPPQVMVTPSRGLIRDVDEQLVVACSVDSAQSFSTLVWFENDTQINDTSAIVTRGYRKSYLMVQEGFDGIEVKYFTCSATNNVGTLRNATTFVVEKANRGGWSWWMESSQCSKTCGIDPGIRLRRRRCFNDTDRCLGFNVEIVSCFPQNSQCPSQTRVSSTLQTAIISQNAAVETRVSPTLQTAIISQNATVGQEATSKTSQTIAYPTVSFKGKKHDPTDSTITICASESRSSVVTPSVASAICAGIASAVIAAVFTYCVMRRKIQKQMNASFYSIASKPAVSTSGEDSLRYASQSVIQETGDESPHTIPIKTKAARTSNTDEVFYHNVQGAKAPYTTRKHSRSRGLEKTLHNLEQEEMYVPMTEGTRFDNPSDDYLAMDFDQEHDDDGRQATNVYANV